jgi:hypothetical protein
MIEKSKLQREIFKPNNLPLLGSLGILAFGDIAFEAWREIKIKHNKKRSNEKK